MRKSKVIILFFLIVIIGGVFLFKDSLLDLYSKLSLKLPQIEKGVADFLKEEVGKQILTPPPLRSQEENLEAFLTRAGVIEFTNTQREKYGLPPLKENYRLDLSAEVKVQDMFENQYFAHDSPSGVRVGDLAEGVGYEFIAIGENLALGNFKNDEALVQAWMDSPGHRENILNNRYQEIGVAVQKGTFEGRTVWLAVQHFGLPLSACNEPDEKTKTTIEENQNQIEELQKTLNLLQVEISKMRPKRGSIYTQKIEEYNSLVAEYNTLLDNNKTLINQYNNQVQIFNNCVVGTE